ncbi:hypothetical protein [Phaeobacter inhibens]|uniref:hypothetical protein n=1 Tax=Phaeobacter inhibens TaxID=221822 RepID=UPI0024914D67|nr:hypothetical protein [Phaeobacter inhibens]
MHKLWKIGQIALFQRKKMWFELDVGAESCPLRDVAGVRNTSGLNRRTMRRFGAKLWAANAGFSLANE